MSTRAFPIPASANRLMVDLICTPVSMKGDRHFAFVRDLAQGTFHRPDLAALQQEARTPREEMIRAHLAKAKGGDDSAEPAETQLWPWEEPIFKITGGVCVLEVNGPLMKGYDAFTCWYYGIMSTDRLIDALTEISNRTDVLVLITKLNTPGGQSIGLPEVADLIALIGQRCLTIAYTSDLACSNGMRIAVAHDYFYPTRSAMVGCIGTYIAIYTYVDMLKEWGIKLELSRDGTLKGIGLMGKEITKEEKAFLDADVLASGEIFKGLVRDRCPGVSEADMQGQWFSGEDAVAKKLATATVTGFAEVETKVQATIAQLLSGQAI